MTPHLHWPICMVMVMTTVHFPSAPDVHPSCLLWEGGVKCANLITVLVVVVVVVVAAAAAAVVVVVVVVVTISITGAALIAAFLLMAIS